MLGLSYWMLPVFSSLVWLGTLMGLLIHWTTSGRPQYQSMDPTQTIAYISDVGAQSLKPLFVTGCVLTSIFLDASFISEIVLRYKGRLARNYSRTEKILSVLSVIFAIVGTIGLICLSVFDTLRHPQLHDLFLVLFIFGYIVSAVFICWEYQRLGIHYRQHKILRYSFWIKLAFILIEVGLAIAFAVTQKTKKYDMAAILEWTVAFVFTFYVMSFFVDLIPALRTKDKSQRFTKGNGRTVMSIEQNDGLATAEINMHDRERRLEDGSSDRTLGRNNVGMVNTPMPPPPAKYRAP
ncbi:hypothetical protein HYALB_00013711 [Hymenoscyphus albidus]|uniref:CWH43-like N-terminal domain-containing protein n=1 Tax=Hymenoscyphus albidus TaxID=595503 RepID=A0A9N9LZW1_9HELO|nr:hypothetical protein HYALB_00013711 [Hymenoscyphus albidus]